VNPFAKKENSNQINVKKDLLSAVEKVEDKTMN